MSCLAGGADSNPALHQHLPKRPQSARRTRQSLFKFTSVTLNFYVLIKLQAVAADYACGVRMVYAGEGQIGAANITGTHSETSSV